MTLDPTPDRMKLPLLALAVGLATLTACQRQSKLEGAAWKTSTIEGSDRLPPRNLYLPKAGTGPIVDPAASNPADSGSGKPTGMVALGRLYVGEPRGAPGASGSSAHRDLECATGSGAASCIVVLIIGTSAPDPVSTHEYLDIMLQGLENGAPSGPNATAVHRGSEGERSHRLVLKRVGPVRVTLSTREDAIGPDNPAGIQTVFTAEMADYTP